MIPERRLGASKRMYSRRPVTRLHARLEPQAGQPWRTATTDS